MPRWKEEGVWFGRSGKQGTSCEQFERGNILSGLGVLRWANRRGSPGKHSGAAPRLRLALGSRATVEARVVLCCVALRCVASCEV